MSVAWLVHELQACQLLLTNTFLNDHELLMDQTTQLYFVEEMFVISVETFQIILYSQ